MVGVIHAVVRPGDPELRGAQQHARRPPGADARDAYRVVVNVALTRAGVDPAVRFGELTHALPVPTWNEGFHSVVGLDYARDLGLHAAQSPFERVEAAALVDRVVARLTPGDPVAVYSQGSGGSSTHIVHRNGQSDDGAIVLDPQGTTPRWMVFHFENQAF